MHIQKLFWLTIAFALLTGCATGKTIKGAEDIQDDGKRNVVLLTSDIKLYVRDRHPSAEETKLTFKCPKGKSGFGGICFNITLPYLGTKEVDGFGLHAFESTGAKAIKMEYGDYAITSAFHGVVVDRIPETTCTYNKKLKKDQCRTRMKDKSDNHSAIFPTPIVVNVSPGTGCYLGICK